MSDIFQEVRWLSPYPEGRTSSAFLAAIGTQPDVAVLSVMLMLLGASLALQTWSTRASLVPTVCVCLSVCLYSSRCARPGVAPTNQALACSSLGYHASACNTICGSS